MKNTANVVVTAALCVGFAATNQPRVDEHAAQRMGRYSVVETSPSKDAAGVMPVGNGDIATGACRSWARTPTRWFAQTACRTLPRLTPALILHRADGEPEALAGFEALPAILGRTAAKVFEIPDLPDTSKLHQEVPSP